MIRTESIQIPFTYAAGGTSSLFMAALRDEGRILATPCPTCERVICPARSFCPVCGGPTGAPVEAGPAGTLVSWTELPDGSTLGLIRLDGADTSMVHRLVGADPAWTAGQRLRARFGETRTGTVTDIEGFEPENGASR